MKLDFKQYLAKSKPLIAVVVKYKYLMCGLVVLLLFLVSIARINTVTSVEMNQQRYDEEILQLDRITFDEEAIEAIKELQNRDVEVELDLPSNRDNPF